MNQFEFFNQSRGNGGFNPFLLNSQDKNKPNIPNQTSFSGTRPPKLEKTERVFLNSIEDGFENVFKKINKVIDSKLEKNNVLNRDKLIRTKFSISSNDANRLTRSSANIISSSSGDGILISLAAESHDVLTLMTREMIGIRKSLSGSSSNIGSEDILTELQNINKFNTKTSVANKTKSIGSRIGSQFKDKHFDDPMVIVKNVLKSVVLGKGALSTTGAAIKGLAALGVTANTGGLYAIPILLAWLSGVSKKARRIAKIQNEEMEEFWKSIPKGNKITDIFSGSIKDMRTKQSDIYGFTKQRYKTYANLAGSAKSAQSRSIQDRYFGRVEREMKLAKIGMRYSEAKLMSTPSSLLLKSGGATTFESKMLLLTANTMDLNRIIAEKLSIIQLGVVGEHKKGYGRNNNSLLGFLEETLEVKRNDRNVVNGVALVKNMFKGAFLGAPIGAIVGSIIGGPVFGSIVGSVAAASLPFLWRMVPALIQRRGKKQEEKVNELRQKADKLRSKFKDRTSPESVALATTSIPGALESIRLLTAKSYEVQSNSYDVLTKIYSSLSGESDLTYTKKTEETRERIYVSELGEFLSKTEYRKYITKIKKDFDPNNLESEITDIVGDKLIKKYAELAVRRTINLIPGINISNNAELHDANKRKRAKPIISENFADLEELKKKFANIDRNKGTTSRVDDEVNNENIKNKDRVVRRTSISDSSSRPDISELKLINDTLINKILPSLPNITSDLSSQTGFLQEIRDISKSGFSDLQDLLKFLKEDSSRDNLEFSNNQLLYGKQNETLIKILNILSGRRNPPTPIGGPIGPLPPIPTANDELAAAASMGAMFNSGGMVHFKSKGTDTKPAIVPVGSAVLPVGTIKKYGSFAKKLGQSVGYKDGVSYVPGGHVGAMLTPGEVVVPPSVVSRNPRMIQNMISEGRRYASGGIIDSFSGKSIKDLLGEPKASDFESNILNKVKPDKLKQLSLGLYNSREFIQKLIDKGISDKKDELISTAIENLITSTIGVIPGMGIVTKLFQDAGRLSYYAIKKPNELDNLKNEIFSKKHALDYLASSTGIPFASEAASYAYDKAHQAGYLNQGGIIPKYYADGGILDPNSETLNQIKSNTENIVEELKKAFPKDESTIQQKLFRAAFKTLAGSFGEELSNYVSPFDTESSLYKKTIDTTISLVAEPLGKKIESSFSSLIGRMRGSPTPPIPAASGGILGINPSYYADGGIANNEIPLRNNNLISDMISTNINDLISEQLVNTLSESISSGIRQSFTLSPIIIKSIQDSLTDTLTSSISSIFDVFDLTTNIELKDKIFEESSKFTKISLNLSLEFLSKLLKDSSSDESFKKEFLKGIFNLGIDSITFILSLFKTAILETKNSAISGALSLISKFTNSATQMYEGGLVGFSSPKYYAAGIGNIDPNDNIQSEEERKKQQLEESAAKNEGVQTGLLTSIKTGIFDLIKINQKKDSIKKLENKKNNTWLSVITGLLLGGALLNQFAPEIVEMIKPVMTGLFELGKNLVTEPAFWKIAGTGLLIAALPSATGILIGKLGASLITGLFTSGMMAPAAGLGVMLWNAYQGYTEDAIKDASTGTKIWNAFKNIFSVGDEGGIGDMLKGMGQYAAYGATIGAFIPIPGVNIVVGAILGAALGGVLGWIGANNFKNFGDDISNFLNKKFGFSISTQSSEAAANEGFNLLGTDRISSIQNNINKQKDKEVIIKNSWGFDIKYKTVKEIISAYNSDSITEEDLKNNGFASSDILKLREVKANLAVTDSIGRDAANKAHITNNDYIQSAKEREDLAKSLGDMPWYVPNKFKNVGDMVNKYLEGDFSITEELMSKFIKPAKLAELTALRVEQIKKEFEGKVFNHQISNRENLSAEEYTKRKEEENNKQYRELMKQTPNVPITTPPPISAQPKNLGGILTSPKYYADGTSAIKSSDFDLANSYFPNLTPSIPNFNDYRITGSELIKDLYSKLKNSKTIEEAKKIQAEIAAYMPAELTSTQFGKYISELGTKLNTISLEQFRSSEFKEEVNKIGESINSTVLEYYNSSIEKINLLLDKSKPIAKSSVEKINQTIATLVDYTSESVIPATVEAAKMAAEKAEQARIIAVKYANETATPAAIEAAKLATQKAEQARTAAINYTSETIMPAANNAVQMAKDAAPKVGEAIQTGGAAIKDALNSTVSSISNLAANNKGQPNAIGALQDSQFRQDLDITDSKNFRNKVGNAIGTGITSAVDTPLIAAGLMKAETKREILITPHLLKAYPEIRNVLSTDSDAVSFVEKNGKIFKYKDSKGNWFEVDHVIGTKTSKFTKTTSPLIDDPNSSIKDSDKTGLQRQEAEIQKSPVTTSPPVSEEKAKANTNPNENSKDTISTSKDAAIKQISGLLSGETLKKGISELGYGSRLGGLPTNTNIPSIAGATSAGPSVAGATSGGPSVAGVTSGGPSVAGASANSSNIGAMPSGNARIAWAKESLKAGFLRRGYTEEQATEFAKAASAQLAEETGWKQKAATVGDNNFFNVKDDPSGKNAGDLPSKRGKDKKEGSNDLYSSYSTPEKGVDAYIDFMHNNPRYAKAGLFQSKTAEEYIQRAKQAGFATNPNYERNINNIMNGPTLKKAEQDWEKIKAERGITAANQAVPNAPSAIAGATSGPAIAGATSGPAIAGATSGPAIVAPSIVSLKNTGSIRNQSITPELDAKLNESVSAVYGPGYTAEVYSGGQSEKGKGKRTGSTRHDNGKAGDVHIKGPDGKTVTGAELGRLGQYWVAKGYGGVGMEMKGGGIHLDQHTDRARTWNYANAKDNGTYSKEQREAINAGNKGILPTLANPNAMNWKERQSILSDPNYKPNTSSNQTLGLSPEIEQNAKDHFSNLKTSDMTASTGLQPGMVADTQLTPGTLGSSIIAQPLVSNSPVTTNNPINVSDDYKSQLIAGPDLNPTDYSKLKPLEESAKEKSNPSINVSEEYKAQLVRGPEIGTSEYSKLKLTNEKDMNQMTNNEIKSKYNITPAVPTTNISAPRTDMMAEIKKSNESKPDDYKTQLINGPNLSPPDYTKVKPAENTTKDNKATDATKTTTKPKSKKSKSQSKSQDNSTNQNPTSELQTASSDIVSQLGQLGYSPRREFGFNGNASIPLPGGAGINLGGSLGQGGFGLNGNLGIPLPGGGNINVGGMLGSGGGGFNGNASIPLPGGAGINLGGSLGQGGFGLNGNLGIPLPGGAGINFGGSFGAGNSFGQEQYNYQTPGVSNQTIPNGTSEVISQQNMQNAGISLADENIDNSGQDFSSGENATSSLPTSPSPSDMSSNSNSKVDLPMTSIDPTADKIINMLFNLSAQSMMFGALTQATGQMPLPSLDGSHV